MLASSADSGAALLSVAVRPTQGEKGMAAEANYRKITWADLQALAASEDVQLTRDGDRILLRFAWAG